MAAVKGQRKPQNYGPVKTDVDAKPFKSVEIAAYKLGLSPNTIYRALRLGLRRGGRYWQYVNTRPNVIYSKKTYK